MQTCPICNKNDQTRLFLKLDGQRRARLKAFDVKYYGGGLRSIFTEDQFRISECKKCDHIFYDQTITNAQLSEMYELHTRSKKKPQSHPPHPSQSITRDRISDFIKSLTKNYDNLPMRILDFGSGTGLWAEICADLGHEVYAFEPHPSRSNASSKYSRISEWTSICKIKFDFIICNQVLEHLLTPAESLRRIRRVCHKDSILYTSVPNARLKSINQTKETWPFDFKKNHILAPFQHLHGFSQKSFLRLHRETSFRPKIDFYSSFTLRGARTIVGLTLGRLFPQLASTSYLFSPIAVEQEHPGIFDG